MSLTTGCVAEIFSGTQVEKPIVQVLSKRGLKGPNSMQNNVASRFSLVISDGIHTASVLLSIMVSQRCHYLADNTIVEISEFIINEVRMKRFVFLLSLLFFFSFVFALIVPS